jgi:SAM-dependent methyltransferase
VGKIVNNLENEIVRKFFDDLATKYNFKYANDKNRYLADYFKDRIDKALDFNDISGSRILDFGAGTGQLYLALKDKGLEFHSYTAIDLSAAMLAQSSVPPEFRLVGGIPELSQLNSEFDNIFCLGVTTYMTPDQVKNSLNVFRSHLKNEGSLVITFTNKMSVNNLIVSLVQPIARILGPKNRLMSQNFKINVYHRKNIEKMFYKKYRIIDLKYINPVIFPLSLFPNLSFYFARFVKKLLPKWIAKLICYEILINAKRIG